MAYGSINHQSIINPHGWFMTLSTDIHWHSMVTSSSKRLLERPNIHQAIPGFPVHPGCLRSRGLERQAFRTRDLKTHCLSFAQQVTPRKVGGTPKIYELIYIYVCVCGLYEPQGVDADCSWSLNVTNALEQGFLWWEGCLWNPLALATIGMQAWKTRGLKNHQAWMNNCHLAPWWLNHSG